MKSAHSIVALVTPMHADNSIDFAALSQLIEWHITAGTQALLLLGTTGEAPTLNDSEKQQLITHAIQQTRQRIPIIVGVSSNCTQRTINNSLIAQALGADCLLIATPYYNKPTQQGLIQHYQAISKAVKLPIILYNVPSRTGCDLLPETVIELSKIAQIIGIKEASGAVNRIKHILTHSAEDFLLWTGCDENTDQAMAYGAHGSISVTANILPTAMRKLIDMGVNQQHLAAKAYQQQLMPVHDILFCETNPIPVKWALQHMSKIKTGIRLPLTPLSTEYQQQMISMLEQTLPTL